MKTVIFTGGPSVSIDAAKEISCDADLIIAADSGADIAVKCGIIPSKVIGDLDSIDPSVRKLLTDLKVPFDEYPVEKDMSDMEICLRSIENKNDDSVVVIGSMQGRPDHMITNTLVALKLHREGMDITITDGVNDFIPLCGDDEVSVSGIRDPESITVSLVPFTSVEGVSVSGLYYELNDAKLIPGSSYTISNRLKEGESSFTVSIKEGDLGIFIVPS